METNTKFDIDKVKETIQKDSLVPALTDEQTNIAKKDLVVKYPKVKRHIIDPPLKTGSKNQKLGMFSWYPSKGAKPDVNGIYGVIILRGAFKTEEEAENRAKFIIQNVDSKHELYIAEMGAEKPLCLENKYARDIKIIESTVDKAKLEHEDQLKKEHEEAQKQMEKRKKELEEDAKRDPSEINLEAYITKLTKLSNINQHYQEQKKELEKYAGIIEQTKQDIIVIDREHPEYKKEFLAKMESTFIERGIPVDMEKIKKNFEEILEGQFRP